MELPAASTDVRLAPNVFGCVVGSQLVFLDLSNDSYVAIELDGQGEAIEARIARMLTGRSAELIQGGLLTKDATAGSAISSRLDATAPSLHVFAPDSGRPFGLSGEICDDARVSARDVWAFFSACVRASRSLRRCHISRVVAEVRELQQRVAHVPWDALRLRREVAVFCRLRPWFPKRYLCLWDSLALAFFLLRRKVQCEWVFAVQMQPFGAHCWLEAGDVLLNDALEYARQFIPIMRVAG